MLILLPLVGIFFNSLPERAEANILLGYKQSLRHFYPANCTVGNTTYAHGQTFKLDCKTQCVCESGRHACSSLCPKEQLPAPEDTISCRSPRLVEVPGHCCKMWLCENPTADVTATCHNSSTSPWTPCSRHCGIGLSTRVTSTTRGCHKLSNTRLCEQRRCDQEDDNNRGVAETAEIFLPKTKDLSTSISRQLNLINSHNKQQSRDMATPVHEHRIRKGHECRHIQRLGPARIRLGPCVSRKLYRPKLCGRCQHSSKCCVPSVSTTIQVELLCPLKANDPISYVSQGHQQKQQQQQVEVQHHNRQQKQQQEEQQQQQLWDTVSLEPIDQEFLQSHQIQIENKFIAVEWILKCECSQNEYCNSDNINNNNNYNYYIDSDNDISSANNNNNSNDTSFQYATIVDDFATETAKAHSNNYYQQQHFGSSSNNQYDYIETKAQKQQQQQQPKQEQHKRQHDFATRT